MDASVQESIENSSRQTLGAFAQILLTLAPEVVSLSFHDAGAETLWLSEDFLLPEDHLLVEQCLDYGRTAESVFEDEELEDHRHTIAIPLFAADGAGNGAVRLGIDPKIAGATSGDPLEQRLAPLLVCLAAELVRCRPLPRMDEAGRAQATTIDQALDAEQFELFLQPIKALRGDNVPPHFEVLLRLRLSDESLVTPAEFFGSAADKKLLQTIDRWVVRTLLVWLIDNRRSWLKVGAVFTVNLSMQSMMDRHFMSYLETCVGKSGLPPEMLCFDVSERSAASGNSAVEASIKRLEALGCEVALDDFGANSARYGYLRQVAVHYFKIDASLVNAAAEDRVAHAMVSAIVQMAGELGVRTVAESVERDEELQAMRSLGVDFAQGYFVGKPRALNEFNFRVAVTS